jgi:hypothetical protein
VAAAIKQQESDAGVSCGKGESGEFGCFQFLPDVWKLSSKDILGYVAPQTKINEEYVAIVKIQRWLDQNKTVRQIALLWNQGNTRKCSSGINNKGVKYNSCAYADVVVAFYNQSL